MAYIRPQAHVIDNLGKLDVRADSTYAKLKKRIPDLIDLNHDPEGLFVLRSRRGEWGEWWERWKRVDGKVKIVKQGWS